MATHGPDGKSDEELDHSPLTFGKYKGQTPSQIAEHDPRWLLYIASEKSEKICSDLLLRDCESE
jgi:hypothetical protein